MRFFGRVKFCPQNLSAVAEGSRNLGEYAVSARSDLRSTAPSLHTAAGSPKKLCALCASASQISVLNLWLD